MDVKLLLETLHERLSNGTLKLDSLVYLVVGSDDYPIMGEERGEDGYLVLQCAERVELAQD